MMVVKYAFPFAGYVEALVIPAGARRIKVVEEIPSHSYLGKNQETKVYKNVFYLNLTFYANIILHLEEPNPSVSLTFAVVPLQTSKLPKMLYSSKLFPKLPNVILFKLH